MSAAEQEICTVKVNVNEIPEADYDLGCSILASSVRCFFEKPGIREEYEEWLKSEAHA